MASPIAYLHAGGPPPAVKEMGSEMGGERRGEQAGTGKQMGGSTMGGE